MEKPIVLVIMDGVGKGDGVSSRGLQMLVTSTTVEYLSFTFILSFLTITVIH